MFNLVSVSTGIAWSFPSSSRVAIRRLDSQYQSGMGQHVGSSGHLLLLPAKDPIRYRGTSGVSLSLVHRHVLGIGRLGRVARLIKAR